MAIPLVNSQTIINATTSPGFNTIRSAIDGILRNDYGFFGGVSLPVLPGQAIARNQWQLLLEDMQKINVHLQGTTIPLTVPAVGSKITAGFTNSLIEKANILYGSRYGLPSISSNQISTSRISSSRSDQWNATITHEVKITWDTSADINYFFNLGSRFVINLNYTSFSGGNRKDLIWKNFIDNYKNSPLVLNKSIYDTLNINVPISITLSATGSPTEQLVFTFTKTSSVEITILIQFLTDVASFNFIKVNSTLTMERSINGGPVSYQGKDYYGIAAPTPQWQTTIDLQTGGSIIPPAPIETRILKVSPESLSYSLTAGGSAASQVIILTNSGNAPLTISQINVNGLTDNGVTPLIVGFTGVISAGSSQSISLGFSSTSSAISGPRTGTLTITSNNDNGPVFNVPITLTVNAVLFDFNISPSTKTWAITSTNSESQKFSIIVSVGSYTAYSASLNGGQASNFSISQDVGGPTVTFNPVGKTNGTYSTNFSIQINGVTKTASITANLSVPISQNLGKWVSAKGPYNSVIGASYDIINDKRYITLGFGMGSDGSDWINVNPGFSDATNLGHQADPKFDKGPVLYKSSTVNQNWNNFLKPYNASSNPDGYGAWIRSPLSHATEASLSYGTSSESAIGPYGVATTRTYTFNCVGGGLHNWEFSLDWFGSFGINDNPNLANGGYNYHTSGSINLNDGLNTVTFTVGAGGNAAVAIRISNAATNEDVWSTRVPIRDSDPYQYWDEVYRIPLTTGVSQSFNVADYCIKDPLAYIGKRWGSMYVNDCMFSVKHDGNGNVDIGMNSLKSVNWWEWEYFTFSGVNLIDLTSMFTPFAFYYNFSSVTYADGHYVWNAGGENATGGWVWTADPISVSRLSNLTPSNAYFLGFDQSGAVRTSVVTTPDTSYPSRPENYQYPPDPSAGP